MNKKIFAIAAVLAVAASAFTACGNEKEDAAQTDASTSISETAADETTAASEDVSAEETVEDEAFEEDAALEDESVEEIFPEDTDESQIPEDGGAESANALMPIAEKALSESEWPAMAEVSDPVILKEFFLLDPENANYKEMLVMQCPISAVMSEIIIINAEDVAAAEADLDARRTKAIETDAWYPADQELAAASIVGTNGNYAYFIIGENAEAAEKSVNDYINANA